MARAAKPLTITGLLGGAILLEVISLATGWTCVGEPAWKTAFFLVSPALALAALVLAFVLQPRRAGLWPLLLVLPAAFLYVAALARVVGACGN
jgi:hypothetical protein